MTDPTPFNYEQSPLLVEEFAAVDLDRTLIHTPAVTDLVLRSLEQYGVDLETIDEMCRYVNEQAGASFDLFAYINEMVPSIDLEVATEDLLAVGYSASAKKELLCDGAESLIHFLQDPGCGIPFVVLTYGKPDYQDFKIRLLRNLLEQFSNEGLNAIITDATNKAAWAEAEWFDADDGYGMVPAGVAGNRAYQIKRLIIIDDKPGHLVAEDARIRGVLVDNESGADVLRTIDVVRELGVGRTLTEIADMYDDQLTERLAS